MKKICMVILLVCGVYVEKSIAEMHCVILAGGNGERLWPLSRQNKPKQLLEVGGASTLLDQAIDRVSPLVPQRNIWISTTEQHAPAIDRLVGNKIGSIIVEPGSRNTGPAILLSCMRVHAQDPDATVLFLPADPFIPIEDYRAFQADIASVFSYVTRNDAIALLGVRPTHPATGYGYIQFDARDVSRSQMLYPVKKFKEKPSYDVAQQYCADGDKLWNIGMFAGKTSIFLKDFSVHAPEMFAGVTAYCDGRGSYHDVVSDSVDYALIEKSKRTVVLPVDFSWCDVGNIEIFLQLKEQVCGADENVVMIESRNNLIESAGKKVALVGVDDLCVVSTDDVLLITKRSQAEKVKKVVQALKREKQSRFL